MARLTASMARLRSSESVSAAVCDHLQINFSACNKIRAYTDLHVIIYIFHLRKCLGKAILFVLTLLQYMIPQKIDIICLGKAIRSQIDNLYVQYEHNLCSYSSIVREDKVTD